LKTDILTEINSKIIPQIGMGNSSVVTDNKTSVGGSIITQNDASIMQQYISSISNICAGLFIVIIVLVSLLAYFIAKFFALRLYKTNLEASKRKWEGWYNCLEKKYIEILKKSK
jgi:hypothetical protein